MKSITAKVFWTFMALVVGILFISILVHSIFFKSYTTAQDKKVLLQVEKDLKAALKEGRLNSDVLVEESLDKGFQMDILDSRTGEQLFSSSGLREKGQGKGMRLRLENFAIDDPSNYGFHHLKSGKQEFLVYLNELDPGIVLILFKATAQIDRSVSDSNRFILITSLLLILPGALLVYALTRRQVKPLLALHDQTTRMAKLDFSGRFAMRGHDEINQLGNSINQISDKLSETIDTLQSDIKRMHEVDQVRKNFIATVSHEFKTPLAILRGYTESLELDLLEKEEEKKAYRVMLDEIDRLTLLVGDLIMLMQHELGQHPLQLEKVKLCQFLGEIVERHEKSSGQIFHLQCDPVEVSLDPRAMTRVLDNFISNALKYGDTSSPILIRVQEDEDALEISTENAGEQIPEDERESIWDSFHKRDPHPRKGSGLGLAINRSILKAHGFEHGFRNTQKGVAFYFRIPKDKLT